jgi:hypothetical protein
LKYFDTLGEIPFDQAKDCASRSGKAADLACEADAMPAEAAAERGCRSVIENQEALSVSTNKPVRGHRRIKNWKETAIFAMLRIGNDRI